MFRSYRPMTVRHVVYHSPEWMLLVEMGWITMTVDYGVATMLYIR